MSWKQYGGIKNLDSYNNISVNNIVADKITVRDKFLTEFQIIGETQLLGDVILGDTSLNTISLKSDVIADRNIDVSGDLHIRNGKLIFSSDGSGVFLKGTDDNRLGINVENPLAVLDISGSYESVLNVYSDQSNNRNIIARNYLQHGIAVDVSDSDSSSLQFYTGAWSDVSNKNNNTEPDSEIKYLNGGILEIKTGQDTRILSQVSISADGSKGHIHNETMVVYDMSNGTYKDLYYKDDTIFKGNALSLIARDSSANTSMNITTPDGKGAVISGGAYPINNAMSMLVLDVSNNSEEKPQAEKPQALMIVSGQKTEKYNTTTSINKYISQTEHYSLDVNGATYIADSQINIQKERNMRFLKVANYEGHTLAAGSHDTENGEVVVYESTDDGVSWKPIPANKISLGKFSDTPEQSVTDIFMNDRARCIIITGSSNALWVSQVSPGSGFVEYVNVDVDVNFDADNINSIYSFHDVSHNHFITARDTKLDIFTIDSAGDTDLLCDVGFIINDVKGFENTIYAVGDNENIKSYTLPVKISISTTTDPTTVNTYNEDQTTIFIEREDASYNGYSDKTYKKVFVYDVSNVIAIGNGIITYTHDGGLNWNSETSVVSDISLNDVHIKSESEAIVVGDNGKIFVSHDAYRTWKQLDNNYINGSGTSDYLTGDTSNNITSITMTNDNNIITTHALTTSPDTGRLLLTYAPSVLNRDTTSTLDVIGSLNVSGDLVLHDRGELKTTDASFGLLKTGAKLIDFGLSGELINIGAETGLVDMKGRLQVADDVSFNSKLDVIGDASFNSDIYVTKNAILYSNLDVCGNTMIHGSLIVDGSLNFRGDLSQTDICHNVLISDQLKVHNLVGDEVALVVQQDNGTDSTSSIAEFKKEGSTKVEITNDGDISMNSVLKIYDNTPSNQRPIGNGGSTQGALYVSGGTRLDGSLNVMSNAYFKKDITFDGSMIIQGDITVNTSIDTLGVNIASGDVPDARTFTYHGIQLDPASRDSLFNVYGGANFHGSIVVDNILYGHQMDISGDASFNADLFASGDISANTNLYLGGDASLNADLFVSGDISANTKFYLGGDASLNADLFVSGDISANTNLYLGGDASLNSKLYVSGDISANSNLYLGGDASLNSKLFVSGDISANSNLYLGGDASLNSKLFIGGDISANTKLFLGGDASLNADLFVSGQTKLGTVNNRDVPLYVDGSGAMRIPVGSTIDRNSLEKETGLIRFNTTDDTFEGYDGAIWGSLGGVSNPDKSSQVYINDVSAIVFETNSIIRETIDNSGNVLFDLSNNQGYGKIKMRQDLSATVLQVSDSSNNNHISIQNQGAFKLIYDQSSAITNSQMEMKVNDMSYNEIILYPSYPEPALTSNSNGVMIGYDNTLYNQLNDMSWNRIGYKDEDGTKLGNTVSISRNGKRVAFGEYEVNSADVSSNVHIYNVFEREIVHLDIIQISDGNVSSIDLNDDGSRIIIGKYNADPSGQIELWEYKGSSYQRVGDLQSGSTGSINASLLGHTTSINNDGTIFAAGQYQNNNNTKDGLEGGVLIFELSDNSIGKIADISMNNDGDKDQYNQMGRSIELNGAGDRIVIGGTIDTSISGSPVYRVYVYQNRPDTYTDNSWNQVLDISNTTAVGKNFGISVAMSNDGNVISVATQNDTTDAIGQVLVYDLSGTGLSSALTFSLRGSPITFNGINVEDTFGASMSLNDDGSVLAIGSGALGDFKGKAFIYKYINGDWTNVKSFEGETFSNLGGIHDYNWESGRLVSDEDGICLDGTGELVIIGAPNLFTADNADGSGNGQVYLHRNQTYTLGVNKKLRVKGDIVIDDGYLDISGYAKIAGDIDIGGNLVLTGTHGVASSLSNQIIFRELYIDDDPDDENFFIGTDITGAHTNQQSMEFGFYDSSGAEATKNDSLMTLMANGNVGIGTTNPQSKLEVLGAEFNENGLKLSKTDGENGSDVGTLQIYQNGDDKGDGITIMGQTNSISHSLWKDVSGTFHISRNNISAQYQFVQTLDGNVGIGTTDPNYKLHVNGDSKIAGDLDVDGSVITPSPTGDDTYHSFPQTIVSSNAGHKYYKIATLPNGATEDFLRIQLVGGLKASSGGDTKLAKMDILLRNSGGFSYEWTMDGNPDAKGHASIFVYEPPPPDPHEVWIKVTDGNKIATFTIDAAGGAEIIRPPTSGSLPTGYTERFDSGNTTTYVPRVRKVGDFSLTGNLGIGTTDPQQKLEVHGNINLGANGASSFIHSGEHVALSADATVLIVSDSNEVDPSATVSDIIFGSGSAVNTHSSRDFTFAQAYPDVNPVPLVEHMRIDGATGNVGIGTTNPSAKLEVNGTVNVTGTVTTGNVLQVGTNTNDDTPKTIFFGGLTDDNDYDFCVIENRVYESDTQKRELLLFSGDNQEGSYGPDRIRLKGANICFDTYNGQTTDRTTTTTKMIIDDEGNVGIGTTDPQSKLEVLGAKFNENGLKLSKTDSGSINTFTTNGTLQIYQNADDKDGGITIMPKDNDSSHRLWKDSDGTFHISKNNISAQYQFVQTLDGNVGIGTTDPQQKLDVRGHIDITASNGGILYFNNIADISSDPSKANFYINHNLGKWLKIGATIQDVGKNWIFIAPTSGKLYLGTDSAMTILGDGYTDTTKIGNVGIGTADPQQKLEVHGNINLGANSDNSFIHGGQHVALSADATVLIVSDSNTINAATTSDIIFGSGSAIDTHSSRDFTFAQAYPDVNPVPLVEHMRIDGGSGNVGIGTTSPDEKLDVNGNVKATSFNATSDIRVKTNIETIEPKTALEQINKLEPKTYKFYDNEETHYGLIAQDAEQIIPEAVNTNGTKMIPSIGETCKLINDGKTIVLDTKTTTDMVVTKLEFDDLNGNKQSVRIESFEGDKCIHLKESIEKRVKDEQSVFVHGHEVNDFRSINYNTIVATSIAATKALTTELNETRTELNETRTELNELKKLVEQLMNK